jgi:hypothetical protein
MLRQLGFVAWVGVLAAATAMAASAAEVSCRDGTQKIKGDWLITPYCQDVLLTQVARENGLPASLEKIRNNNNYKKEICRTVFTDIRVTDTCLNAGIPEYRH